jgi:hypothetical protein
MNEDLPDLWSIDLDQVESPVLKRLIAEVRADLRRQAEGPRPRVYDRIHTRHNRSMGGQEEPQA